MLYGALHSVGIIGVLPVLKVMLSEEGFHGWVYRAVAEERLDANLDIDLSGIETGKAKAAGRWVWTGGSIRNLDHVALAEVYRAARAKVQRANPNLPQTELVRKALEEAVKAIKLTQPQWDALRRSEVQLKARRSILARMLARFSSQTTQNVNYVLEPLAKGDHRLARRRLARVILLQTLRVATVSWLWRMGLRLSGSFMRL